MAGTKNGKTKQVLSRVGPRRKVARKGVGNANASTSKNATSPPNSQVFTLFDKLPVEIQLLIWAWAATRACIFKFGNEFNIPLPAAKPILRAIPAMMHTCRAARDTIVNGIGGGTFPLSAGLFDIVDTQGERVVERFHFATKLDTLWIPCDFLYRGLNDQHFTMSLAPCLRHLVTERNFNFDINGHGVSASMDFFGLIHKHFPNLEAVTILLTHPKMYRAGDVSAPAATCLAHYHTFTPRILPESNGEINMNFLGDADNGWQDTVENERVTVQESYDRLIAKNAGRKMPILKFRDQQQFLEGREVLN